MRVWLAVGYDGVQRMYGSKPYRDQYKWRGYEIRTWYNDRHDCFSVGAESPFPQQTWEDEPIEVEITINKNIKH